MDDGELLTLRLRQRSRAGPTAKSKSKLRLQLNHPRRRIASKTSAEDAGGWLLQIKDLPKCLSLNCQLSGKPKLGWLKKLKN